MDTTDEAVIGAPTMGIHSLKDDEPICGCVSYSERLASVISWDKLGTRTTLVQDRVTVIGEREEQPPRRRIQY
jgi:hypothetical protein